MAGHQKRTFLGAIELCLFLSLNVGVIISAEVVCDETEWLSENNTCEKCPICPPGQRYPDDKDCGYGRGGNITCEPCPPGKFRDAQDDVPRCKTCLDCENRYKKTFEFKCRPEINAKCGKCLPGFEEDPSSFLRMPCKKCTDQSTSEVCVAWLRKQKAEAVAKAKEEEEKKVEALAKAKEEEEKKMEALAKAKEEEEKVQLKRTVIVLGIVCGLLLLMVAILGACLCKNRRVKRSSGRNRSNDRNSNGANHTSMIPLNDTGAYTPCTYIQSDSFQQAVGTDTAEPQYQLEDDDLESQVSQASQASQHPSGNQPGSDGHESDDRQPDPHTYCSSDSLSTCASPPQPFSAPNSGYYTMSALDSLIMPSISPSEASTALVQDIPHVQPRNPSNMVFSEFGSSSGSSGNIAQASAAQHPPTFAFLGDVRNVGCPPPAPDVRETVVKTHPHNGARPKQRNGLQESPDQAAETQEYTVALAHCGGRKVVNLTEREKITLGLKLTPSDPPISGAPHFHQVAESLRITYDVFKCWREGKIIVQWMCEQETHVRDLLAILHNTEMVAARNYLVGIIKGWMDCDQSPPRYDDGDDGEDGGTEQRFNYRRKHPPVGGIAEDDSDTEELVVDDAAAAAAAAAVAAAHIPIVVQISESQDGLNGGYDNQLEGAAAAVPEQEIKGGLRYPVSVTDRGTQPLTPPPNENMDPFRVR